MGRTIPRNIDRRGEHLSRCDVCGVMWLRSSLRRGHDGRLRCPHDSAGRDELTLGELTAARAALIAAHVASQLPADGAVPDTDSQGRPSSSSSYAGPIRRLIIEDAYDGDVPGGF